MRKGKISLLDKISLEILVKKHISLSDILRELDLDTSSGNFRTLKRKLISENINYDHIKNGPGYKIGQINFFKKKTKLEEILVIDSNFSSTHLKKKLISENILPEICSKCGLGNLWNEEKLCLQLDHINGVSNDNRIENLRLLCPNCHSQTTTYAARNKIKKHRPNKLIKIRKTKIDWPSDENLISLLQTSNYVQVALALGVSDNAIRKRLKIKGFNPKDFT